MIGDIILVLFVIATTGLAWAGWFAARKAQRS